MCKECGIEYSFVFGIQFHKADCSQDTPCPLLAIWRYGNWGCAYIKEGF